MSKPTSISVVIATFGRPEQLRHCLSALAKIDYPREHWRVLVVDDGSPVTLDSIVRQFADSLAIDLVRQTNQGAGAARNRGARLCSGELVVFTDDDCCPREDWLTVLAKQHQENPTACIGGKTINALNGNPYSAASQLLIDYLYEYYFPGNSSRFFASNNVAFPKQAFDSINGFDTRFPRAGAEDRDICRRWIAAGFNTIYAPDAVVYHEHLMTFRGFLRQHFNYGRGAFHFHSLKASDSNEKLRVEPLKFYIQLLLYPVTKQRDFNSLFLVVLLFFSQAANAFGFFFEKSAAAKRTSLALSHDEQAAPLETADVQTSGAAT